MVELIIMKFSDASFPYLPYGFLITLHFNSLSYPSLKTLDFNMHWKSIWHGTGRENLLEKIRSCWWLILPCWYKGFQKQPVSRAVCPSHPPVCSQVACSASLMCQVYRVWSAAVLPGRVGTTGVLPWHMWNDTIPSAVLVNFRACTAAVHFSKSHQPAHTWDTALAESTQECIK